MTDASKLDISTPNVDPYLARAVGKHAAEHTSSREDLYEALRALGITYLASRKAQ